MSKLEDLKKLDKSLEKALDIEREEKKSEENRSFFSNLFDTAFTALINVFQKESNDTRTSLKSLESKLDEQSKSFDKSIKTVADKKIDITVPEIKIPEIKIPEIKLPVISVPKANIQFDTQKLEEVLRSEFGAFKSPIVTVPKPEVTVNIPKSELKWPKGKLPVSGDVGLRDVDMENPLPVQLRDSNGKPVSFGGSGVSGGKSGGPLTLRTGPVSNNNPLPVIDPMLEIARGNLAGHSVINKFGRNDLCGATKEEIWDGNVAYIWPTSASITHIRTAADTPDMDGMVVEIQGLDTNWDLVVQNATIDAATSTATEVLLKTPLRRVFRMKVLSSKVTTDPIWVGATGMTAATAKAIIQVGNNQTLMAIYTVPAGCTAYMTNYYATANPNLAAGTLFNVQMWARDNANGYAPQLKHTKGLDKDASSNMQHDFAPYYKFTEKTDIFLTGSAGTNTVSISAGFDLILIAN